MLKKKGLFAPRKKIIRKPKFILGFAVCLAFCLIVSSVLTNKYLDRKKEDAIEMLETEYLSHSQTVADALGAYADAKTIADSGTIGVLDLEEKKNDVETALYYYGMFSGEFGVAYLEQEKLMETPTGYYSAVRFGQYSGKPQDTFFLEDDSYIAPLSAYKDGKYDPIENTKNILKYRGESETFDTYARLGWAPKVYVICWKTIYVNEETHRFLPGEVEIMDYFKDEVLDEFDLTPQDTKGYTLIKVEGDLQMWLHGYLDPEKAEERLEEMFCAKGNFGGDTLMEKHWPMWSFRTTRTYYEKSSVYELLPISSRVMWVQDTIAAVLAALVISLIWYLKKKSVWEIFEYRKSTTEAMAHDLKTPLAAISMYAECMEDQPEKAGEYTGRIRENVTEMNQMLENILQFSKNEGGEKTISRSKVDMENLIRETISKYADLFEKKRIEVKVTKEEDCVIETDEKLMRQAVENLLSNCAKYAGSESEVRILIKSSELKFSNRTSLSCVNLEELKKPFVKGDSSRGENGTGLGLSIVDNNLKIQGYRLGLELEEGWFTAEILL